MWSRYSYCRAVLFRIEMLSPFGSVLGAGDLANHSLKVEPKCSFSCRADLPGLISTPRHGFSVAPASSSPPPSPFAEQSLRLLTHPVSFRFQEKTSCALSRGTLCSTWTTPRMFRDRRTLQRPIPADSKVGSVGRSVWGLLAYAASGEKFGYVDISFNCSPAIS